MSGLRRNNVPKPAKASKTARAARKAKATEGSEPGSTGPTEAVEPVEPALAGTAGEDAPVSHDAPGSAETTGLAAMVAAGEPTAPSARSRRRARSRKAAPATETAARETTGATPPPPAPPAPSRTGRGRGAKPGPDAVPAVNLLSPWVLEEIHVRVLRRRFGYAAVVLALVLGLAWGGLTLQGNQARDAAAQEESLGTTLSSQIQQMAPVRAYVGGVDVRAQAVTDAMEGQVAFSAVLRGLEAALPPNASLDTMAVTLPTPPALGTAATDATGTTGTVPGDPAAGTCPGPDPFAANDVLACVDITGTASSRDVVSTLVLRLSRNPAFSEPFVSATTASEGEDGTSVTFTGSVALTDQVVNTRFADLVERLGSAKVAAAAQAAREARESAKAQESQESGSRSADPDDTVTAGSTTAATTEEPS